MNEYTEGYLPYPPLPSSPLSGGAIVGLPTRRRSLPGGSAHRDSPREARNNIPGGGSFAFAFASASPSPFGSGCGFLEDSLIICGLVAVQLIGAAYMVLLAPILSLGLNPLFLVAFGSLATSVFTFPFAVAFEKKKWPSRISPMLMAQFALLALGGVTAFQGLMLLGMKKTSPAIAAAMPNLAPGFIFVIAACLRFEKVDMKCLYTRVKILGTLLCLGGAITMSFLQSPSSTSPVHAAPRSPVASRSGLAPQTVYHEWVVGCGCLLAAVLIVSCNTVLQAATMVHFPAPFTLCAVTSMIGAVLTAIAQIISEGRIEMGSPVISLTSVVALILLGSMMSSVCVAFQTWAVKRKGPVIVSMFSPTQTVGTAILSAIFLGQVIQPGSLAGILVLFFGLYIVLWAKKKEGLLLPTSEETSTVSTQQTEDIEKPLL
ncbi:WAT1-related protein, partial [Ananas comosus]